MDPTQQKEIQPHVQPLPFKEPEERGWLETINPLNLIRSAPPSEKQTSLVPLRPGYQSFTTNPSFSGSKEKSVSKGVQAIFQQNIAQSHLALTKHSHVTGSKLLETVKPSDTTSQSVGQYLGRNAGILNTNFLSRTFLWLGGVENTYAQSAIMLWKAEEFSALWTSLGMAAGGIALPASIHLLSKIAKKMGGPTKAITGADVGTARFITKVGDEFQNALGEPVTSYDMKHLRKGIYEFNIWVGLQNQSNHHGLDLELGKYFLINEKKQLTWLDGSLVEKTDFEILKTGREAIQSTALMLDQTNDDITAMVKLIAKNTGDVTDRLTIFDALGILKSQSATQVDGNYVEPVYIDAVTNHILSNKEVFRRLLMGYQGLKENINDHAVLTSAHLEKFKKQIIEFTGGQDPENLPKEYLTHIKALDLLKLEETDNNSFIDLITGDVLSGEKLLKDLTEKGTDWIQEKFPDDIQTITTFIANLLKE